MQGAPTASTRTHPVGTWLGGLLVAAAGAWVFRGALVQFFAADDFPALARAMGLLPRLHGLWRLLSGQLYFDLMRPIAGLDPRGYHAASLLLHLGCAVALYGLLRRHLSTPAALAGATCFATHPAHFTTTYWVSAVGGPLALLLALGALFAGLRRDPLRWLAVPLFAAALLARESVVLLPLGLVVMLEWESRLRSEGGAHAWRDPLALTLAGLALALAGSFAAGDVMGAQSGSAAYRLDLGRGLLANLMTYLGWTANFLLPTVRRFQDAADPLVYGWGAGLLLLWLAGSASIGLRRRGWLAAGALYLAFLLPVLPLGHHTYHYYLQAPLAGFAWCVAAALDLCFERLSRPDRPTARPRRGPAAASPPDHPGPGALRWGLALAAVALFTANGALLVRRIETTPFPGAPGLHSDATVDRAAIAKNAIASLRESPLPERARILFWSPIGRSLAGDPGRPEGYFERNVRAALFDGLAVRVFFPGVDSVRFVSAYRSLPGPYRYAVYRPDGRLRVASSAVLDSVLAGSASSR